MGEAEGAPAEPTTPVDEGMLDVGEALEEGAEEVKEVVPAESPAHSARAAVTRSAEQESSQCSAKQKGQ